MKVSILLLRLAIRSCVVEKLLNKQFVLNHSEPITSNMPKPFTPTASFDATERFKTDLFTLLNKNYQRKFLSKHQYGSDASYEKKCLYQLLHQHLSK